MRENRCLAVRSGKIDRVVNYFLKKIDTGVLIDSIRDEDDNKTDQIKNIFNNSNLVFLQGGPGTGKTTESGESLGRGSFVVRGQRTWHRDLRLELGLVDGR